MSTSVILHRLCVAAAVCGSLLTTSPARAQQTPCPFDKKTLTFAGTPLEQATCLLRPVKPLAQIGAPLAALPAPLADLVGQPIKVTKDSLRAYLKRQGIREQDLGGSLDEPLSRGNDNDPATDQALYFVIHDTSTPNYLLKPIPATINTKAWVWNDFTRYKAVAHVFVNRLGESATRNTFQTPYRATKFELNVVKVPAKGRFLHVELIQPRRSKPGGAAGNDALSPTPGFTDAQLRRLALLYVAASVRRGSWLIPAYHATLDTSLADGHDDPQQFALDSWAQQLTQLLRAMGA